MPPIWAIAVTYAMDATLTFPMVSGSGRTYTSAEIRDRTELVLEGPIRQSAAVGSRGDVITVRAVA